MLYCKRERHLQSLIFSLLPRLASNWRKTIAQELVCDSFIPPRASREVGSYEPGRQCRDPDTTSTNGNKNAVDSSLTK